MSSMSIIPSYKSVDTDTTKDTSQPQQLVAAQIMDINMVASVCYGFLHIQVLGLSVLEFQEERHYCLKALLS